MTDTTTILIDGQPSDGRISVTDSSVLRGDGCFEVLKAYGGKPLFLEEHLSRLERSAAALQIGLPGRDEVSSWIRKVGSEGGDCAIRVVVTRGSALPGEDDAPRVIVFAHPWSSKPGPERLLPVDAPWHSEGIDWDLSGAKVISYAPNLSATRRAQAAGFDDALLVGRGGEILEGPTFSLAWVIANTLETPTLDLGILDSITRQKVLEDARAIGLTVSEGRWPLERLHQADEVISLSTIREVQSVSAIGGRSFGAGPFTSELSEKFAQRVRSLG